MSNEKTIRTHSGKIYTLQERLGGGAIASVWRAEGEDGKRVAVKIAHPALHPDLRRQFNTERETIERILGQGGPWPAGEGKPPVPSFIEEAGENALVMEWVEAPSLAAWVKEKGLAERQEGLIEPARQYVWLLELLHTRVGIGQSDRKVGDLRWDEGEQRLVVLDWNVVGERERAAEDIYKFGEMWYALLLEVPPQPGEWARHSEWGELSLGWQELLEACLRVNRQRRPAAAELLKRVEGLQGLYRRTGEGLLEEGQRLLEEFRRSQGAERWERLHGALLRLDLAWRKGEAEAKGPWQEAQESYGRRGEAAIQQVKEDLRLGLYRGAEGPLAQARDELEGEAEGRLRVARWRCLVGAAQASLAEGTGVAMRGRMGVLISAVERMEEGRWAAGKEGVQTALAGLPEGQMASRLRSLPAEVEVRLELAEAEEKARQERFEEAAEGMDRARQKMEEISYRSELEAVVVDLAAEGERYRELDRTRGRLKAIREEMPGVVEKGEYGQAEALYREGLPLTAGDPQARQELEREVRVARALAELERGLQEGETEGQVVARLQGLLRSFPDHKAVRKKAEGLIGSMLLPGLEQQARDARRPGEVRAALDQGEKLQQLAREAGFQALDPIITPLVTALQGKQQVQRQIALEYQKGDQQLQDKAVERAREEGIEIFDDPFFSIDRMSRFTWQELEIERLRTLLRDREEVERSLERKKQEAEDLINRVGADLEKAWDRVTGAGRQLQQLVEQQKGSIQQFVKQQEQGVSEARDSFQQFVGQQEQGVSEAKASFQQFVEQQEREVAGLVQRFHQGSEQKKGEITQSLDWYNQKRGELAQEQKRFLGEIDRAQRAAEGKIGDYRAALDQSLKSLNPELDRVQQVFRQESENRKRLGQLIGDYGRALRRLEELQRRLDGLEERNRRFPELASLPGERAWSPKAIHFAVLLFIIILIDLVVWFIMHQLVQ